MSIFEIFRIKRKLSSPWAKFYKEEDMNIKIPNISMYDQVKISAYKYPNNIAISYEGKKINYKSLQRKIDILANSFYSYGIRKGDIVTICLPNIPEALYALYALNKIGAIANMLHPLSAEVEIRESIESTKSRLILFTDMFFDKLLNIIEETNVEKVLIVSPGDSLSRAKNIVYKFKTRGKYKKIPLNDYYLKLNKFIRKHYDKTLELTKRFGKDTPAVILHSGGTSGKQKNVVIQNRAFILGSKQEKICLKKLRPGDSCLGIMPNFHGFGLSVCMHTPLTLGCYTILVPKFEATKFDVLLKKTKPTCVLGVPTLFEALISSRNVKKLDLSNLKYVISGGDILSDALENKVNDYLKAHNSSTKITQGYGLSESLAAVTLAYDNVNKPGSIGIPFPSNHIKIIDPATRNTLKCGETGEIVIHSKALMMGYLNDESETNAALQVHEDGHIWLHTGDLGYMDEDGFIFYQGREKRMIITSGYNVYPNHIEEVIEAYPDVLQCSVVGVAHPYKGSVVKAFVVLKEGRHSLLVKNDLKSYCKKNLARYMVPSTFVFRKQLPKTKLGKVDFKKLQSDIGSDDDE